MGLKKNSVQIGALMKMTNFYRGKTVFLDRVNV